MIAAALELAALDWPVFPCIETPGEQASAPTPPTDSTTPPPIRS